MLPLSRLDLTGPHNVPRAAIVVLLPEINVPRTPKRPAAAVLGTRCPKLLADTAETEAIPRPGTLAKALPQESNRVLRLYRVSALVRRGGLVGSFVFNSYKGSRSLSGLAQAAEQTTSKQLEAHSSVVQRVPRGQMAS